MIWIAQWVKAQLHNPISLLGNFRQPVWWWSVSWWSPGWACYRASWSLWTWDLCGLIQNYHHTTLLGRGPMNHKCGPSFYNSVEHIISELWLLQDRIALFFEDIAGVRLRIVCIGAKGDWVFLRKVSLALHGVFLGHGIYIYMIYIYIWYVYIYINIGCPSFVFSLIYIFNISICISIDLPLHIHMYAHPHSMKFIYI